MTSHRARGVMVTPLDLTELVEEVTSHAEIRPPQSVGTHLTYALATTSIGQHYLICDEGVGWALDGHDYDIPFYREDPGFISMAPEWAVKISVETATKYATLPPVDLADFIRSFGARLESNFWSWHRLLAFP